MRHLAIASFLLLGSVPAHAEMTVAANCSRLSVSGGIAACDGYANISLRSEGEDLLYAFKVTAPSAHCSPVAYSVVKAPYATGADVLGISGYLQPGQSEFIYVGKNWPKGQESTFRLMATGLVQGCNTVGLQNWSAVVQDVIVPE